MAEKAAAGVGDLVPLSSLDKKQLEALQKFKELIKTWDLDPLEQEEYNERGLCRFLRARNYNLKKSADMLKETVAWRRSYKPHFICYDDVSKQAKAGSNYVFGKDKLGHPAVIMRSNRDPPFGTPEEKLQLIIFNLEESIRRMKYDAGVEKLIYIIDLTGFSVRNNNSDSKIGRQWVSILQNHYPERCFMIAIVNAPKLFTMFWAMLSPFVDKVTRKKVHFVGGTLETKKKFFLQHFEPDQIEVDFGGSVVFDAELGRAKPADQAQAATQTPTEEMLDDSNIPADFTEDKDQPVTPRHDA